MRMKAAVVRFRLVVIALNCLLASISLINLYTIATGAVRVDIPDEEDFAWTIDTRLEEANFLANFTVTNSGLYDITDLNIHAIVKTEKGNLLVEYEQNDLSIPSRETKKFYISAVLPFERIDVEEWKSLMVNDSVFYLDVDIRANYLWGLGTFVVDDVLEYQWEAPLKNMEGKTDSEYVELLNFLISENASLKAFADALVQGWNENQFLSQLDWDDASLYLESLPLGDNTSRITARLTLELFEGRRTVSIELTFLMKKEVDNIDFSFEDFNFKYS
jgi:hypothetical protein